EGMPSCSPVLLEPIMHVRIHVPNDSTSKVNGMVSGRRGQLMGFDARAGWKGWDTVEAQMPLAELSDLIIDLRSLTQGVGTYEMTFDHLAELTGKLADQITAARKAASVYDRRAFDRMPRWRRCRRLSRLAGYREVVHHVRLT